MCACGEPVLKRKLACLFAACHKQMRFLDIDRWNDNLAVPEIIPEVDLHDKSGDLGQRWIPRGPPRRIGDHDVIEGYGRNPARVNMHGADRDRPPDIGRGAGLDNAYYRRPAPLPQGKDGTYADHGYNGQAAKQPFPASFHHPTERRRSPPDAPARRAVSFPASVASTGSWRSSS